MFRFTIRDVLWLTVVVAMGLGWSMSQWHARRQLDETQRALGMAKSLLRQYEWKIRVFSPEMWHGSVLPKLELPVLPEKYERPTPESE